MEHYPGLFCEEFIQEDFETENAERASAQYWAAINYAADNKLVFPELFDHLSKVSNQQDCKAIYEHILAFQKAPYKKTAFRAAIEKISKFDGQYGPDVETYLDELDIPDLYHLRKALLSGEYQGLTGNIKAIAEAVLTQVNLLHRVLTIRYKLGAVTNTRDGNLLYANEVIKGYKLMERIGHRIEIDHGDCDLEQMTSKPHAFYMNHQGGGLETYTTSYMFTGNEQRQVYDNAILVKDALIKLPLFGELLRKIGATPVERNRVQSKEERDTAIDEVVNNLVQIMDSNRGIVVFPEGTRSKDGGFASTPLRLEWAQDFLGKLRPEVQKRGIPEVLVVCDTLLAFPTPLEKIHKWPNSESRINAGMSYKFHKIPADLSLEDNPKDEFDQNNFFGFARHRIAETQRQEIRKLLAAVKP